MITTTFAQPESQLGVKFSELLNSDGLYKRIIFVSAFTALKTILRFREKLLNAAQGRTTVRFVLGIDLFGTSREVLEELLTWNCEVYIYHNPIPRNTFHPKVYLFERESDSHLFLGSNNLTDGGLYSNYEAYSQYLFEFPSDRGEYERVLGHLSLFLEPSGPNVCLLSRSLIDILLAHGVLATEVEARLSQRRGHVHSVTDRTGLPTFPFSPISTPLPPLLPRNIRDILPPNPPQEVSQPEVDSFDLARLNGTLVWRKKLTRSDALQVQPGSHHVGGVRLVQARFANPDGTTIDQTTYFRNLFDEYDWEREGRYPDQEHTFVPMRVIIRGQDYGIRNFEISHKPSGEAGQDNYTTIMRWGRGFVRTIEGANLMGAVLSLYETPNSDTQFLINIEDS